MKKDAKKKSILQMIKETIEKRPIYMSYIDSTMYSIEEIIKISKSIEHSHADMVAVGGILNVDTNYMNQVIKNIKENTNRPVLILPGNAGMVSKYADAILFTSLLNSRNQYWITGAQAISAPLVRYFDIEVIPTSYIVIEPGSTSSWIGDANPIPRNKPEIMKSYALYSELSGKEIICIDTGMVNSKVPEEIIKTIKKNVNIPVAFYGKVGSMKDLNKLSKAGADIIITSTIFKKHQNKLKIEDLLNLVRKRVNKPRKRNNNHKNGKKLNSIEKNKNNEKASKQK